MNTERVRDDEDAIDKEALTDQEVAASAQRRDRAAKDHEIWLERSEALQSKLETIIDDLGPILWARK